MKVRDLDALIRDGVKVEHRVELDPDYQFWAKVFMAPAARPDRWKMAVDLSPAHTGKEMEGRRFIWKERYWAEYLRLRGAGYGKSVVELRGRAQMLLEKMTSMRDLDAVKKMHAAQKLLDLTGAAPERSKVGSTKKRIRGDEAPGLIPEEEGMTAEQARKLLGLK